MTVAVDVLGPLRLRVGDVERQVGGRRERLVLALLASHAGRHVGDARLVDEIWGDDPPTTASGSLQVAISRLRKAIGDNAELRRDPSGYTLAGAEVDAAAFSELIEGLAELPPPVVVIDPP